MLLSLVSGDAARARHITIPAGRTLRHVAKIEVEMSELEEVGERAPGRRVAAPESGLHASAYDRVDCGISDSGPGARRSLGRRHAGRGRHSRCGDGAHDLGDRASSLPDRRESRSFRSRAPRAPAGSSSRVRFSLSPVRATELSRARSRLAAQARYGQVRRPRLGR